MWAIGSIPSPHLDSYFYVVLNTYSPSKSSYLWYKCLSEISIVLIASMKEEVNV